LIGYILKPEVIAYGLHETLYLVPMGLPNIGAIIIPKIDKPPVFPWVSIEQPYGMFDELAGRKIAQRHITFRHMRKTLR